MVILPNYLTPDEQRALIRWGLSEQARTPNDTNLRACQEAENSPSDLSSQSSEKFIVQPKRPEGEERPDYQEGSRPRIDNVPGDATNFQEECSKPKPPPPPSSHLPPIHASKLIYKLRWANIGYYYHWSSKSYDFSKPKTEYPQYLHDICKRVVASIDWKDVWDNGQEEDWGGAGPDWEEWPDSYEPDAGIVNYYQPGDTLCGHVDRSEVCATSPLVSISLGNSAVFLIGGITRDVDPVPIVLRSGDIVIMSGPGCRRAYHGVPRILGNTLPAHLRVEGQDKDWEPYANYLQTTRINVNVRQVFPRGFNPLEAVQKHD